jgi:hypothetical protein
MFNRKFIIRFFITKLETKLIAIKFIKYCQALYLGNLKNRKRTKIKKTRNS